MATLGVDCKSPRARFKRAPAKAFTGLSWRTRHRRGGPVRQSVPCPARRTSITFGFDWPPRAYFPEVERSIERARQAGCVPVLPAWVICRDPDPNPDFVIPSIDRQTAEKIAEKGGKRLCGQ